MANGGNQVFNLNALFGDKPWYKSMTAWGLMIFVGATAVADQACSGGILPVDSCETIKGWLEGIGTVLTGLGIRRAATSKNVA